MADEHPIYKCYNQPLMRNWQCDIFDRAAISLDPQPLLYGLYILMKAFAPFATLLFACLDCRWLTMADVDANRMCTQDHCVR